MSVKVLKIGHRPRRDKRVTTHLILAARALGASGVVYTGIKDSAMEDNINEVVLDWGGSFNIEYSESWRKEIENFKQRGKLIHLTMYGLPIQQTISQIRVEPIDKLIIVGGAKVPGDMYRKVDWNIAISSQPHSEISALAVFLHELYEGKELDAPFEGAKLKVTPQKFGKKMDKTS